MPKKQIKAGHCLQGILNKKKTGELSGLLKRLSCFDVDTNVDLELPSNSLLAVMYNMVSRGLPTIPSMLVEEELSRAFPNWVSKAKEKLGKIGFDLTIDSSKVQLLHEALHIIDPHLNPSDYPTDVLGSSFERDFLFRYLSDDWRFLYQLLEPQRPLSELVSKRDQRRFTRQMVDFCLDIPYEYKEEIQVRNEVETVTTSKGYIIEIDGAEYHRWGQLRLDRHRDSALIQNKWKCQRIRSNSATQDIQELKNKLEREDFLQIIKKNFSRQWTSEWKEALQVALTPFGIARIQLLLCQILSNEHLAQKGRIRIAAIERDVPCVALAIKDFIKTYETLSELSATSFPKLPTIELDVFSNSQFINSRLHQTQIPKGIYSGNSLNEYDVVFDISMLRRNGLENTSVPENRIIVRSAQSFQNSTPRVFQTKASINYRTIDSENEPQLAYFLQNIFRKSGFRPGQIPILNRALQNKTVIGLLPTGGGKSLTYQLAAMLQPGITVVVDPIKSLMQDQFYNLVKIGIDGCNFINSSLDTIQRKHAIEHFEKGEVLFSFISPERFLIEEFRQTLKSMPENGLYFSYCVLDEVHCLSEWGHDFRPAYLKLGSNAYALCQTASGNPIPIFGLTATASYDVLADIERELTHPTIPLKNPTVRFENTTRNEIQYNIIPVETIYSTFQLDALPEDFPPMVAGGSPRAINGDSKEKKLIEFFDGLEVLFEQFSNETVLEDLLRHSYRNLIPKDDPGLSTEEEYIKNNKLNWVDDIDAKMSDHQFGGIVFCPHKKETAALGVLKFKNSIGEHYPNIKTGYFMGTSGFKYDLAQEIEKNSITNQIDFIEDRLDLMIATKAFGMGIDKPNVRYSVHVNYPASIESFVQEGGRTGRDKQLSIVNLLYSDSKFSSLRLSGNQINRLELPQATKTYLSQIRNRVFEQEVYYNDVLPRILSNNQEWIDLVSSKSTDSNVDKDVNLFFFNNSFKGQIKEKTNINELLNQIWHPAKNNIAQIADELKTNLGLDDLRINFWKQQRIYINSTIGSFGHLTLPELNVVVDNNFTLNGELNPTNALGLVKGSIEHIPAQNLEEWSKQLTPIDQEAGILSILEEIEEGEQAAIFIPFENTLGEANFYASRLHQFIESNVSPAISLPWVKDNCISFISSFEDLIDKISGHGQSPQDWFENLSEAALQKIENIYFLPRKEDDTAKAVYRLFSIGVIDDYTIDYNANLYNVSFKRKSPESYKRHFEQYLLRYKSQKTVEKLIGKIPEEDVRSTIEAAVEVLIDFVYEQIAKKRERAIDDMEALIEEGLKADNKFEANKIIKEFIYTYFNSKYGREYPPHEVAVGDEVEEYSLTNDTDQSRNSTWEITYRYLRVLGIDSSGGFDDNVKHLRGAAIRLLRANPENSTLTTLRGFTELMLAVKTNDQKGLEEGEKSLLEGVVGLIREEGVSDLVHVSSRVNELKSIVSEYLIDGEKILFILDNTVNYFLLKQENEWLEKFNNKFLKDYDNQ